MQALYIQYTVSTCRIISKVPNQHCTYALLMCMAMWQVWLHVHVITTSSRVKPCSQSYVDTYMYC